MSNTNRVPANPGLSPSWVAAANIDLSAALAVGRASARALADLSAEAAAKLHARLEEEAVALDDKGGLESSTAAMLVRRVLDPAG